MDVEVRSVSARTVLATVKAMAERAAGGQSTIRRAEPLWGRLATCRRLAIGPLSGFTRRLTIGGRLPTCPTLILIALHADWQRQSYWWQARWVWNQGGHFNPDRGRQHVGADPTQQPFWFLWRRVFAVAEAAISQLVGEHKRTGANLDLHVARSYGIRGWIGRSAHAEQAG